MADVGIKGPAQASAPLTYKLADAAEFIPRSIVATFDGTSATSSFYPCLVLKDAGGLEVCRIPTSASVAAGGSAEVSWFPGVKPLRAAAASCYLWSQTPYTHQQNVSFALPWPHFETTDDSVFGTNLNANANLPTHNQSGDKYLVLMQAGAYVAEATAVFATGSVNYAAEIQNLTSFDYTDDGGTTRSGSYPGSNPSSGGLVQDLMTQSMRVFTITAGRAPGAIYYNFAGPDVVADLTVNSYSMVVHWLGGGIGSDVVVY